MRRIPKSGSAVAVRVHRRRAACRTVGGVLAGFEQRRPARTAGRRGSSAGGGSFRGHAAEWQEMARKARVRADNAANATVKDIWQQNAADDEAHARQMTDEAATAEKLRLTPKPPQRQISARRPSRPRLRSRRPRSRNRPLRPRPPPIPRRKPLPRRRPRLRSRRPRSRNQRLRLRPPPIPRRKPLPRRHPRPPR